jgi:hypothetical protein
MFIVAIVIYGDPNIGHYSVLDFKLETLDQNFQPYLWKIEFVLNRCVESV